MTATEVRTAATATADRTVSRATAFGTWAELQAALDTGYVPTVSGRTKAGRDLVRLTSFHGYKAWNPKTGQNW